MVRPRSALVALASALALSALGSAPGGATAAFAPFIDTSTYRIGMSHDGNQHDPDDILASAFALAIIGEANLGSKFVHMDYSNHLGNNNATMAADMKTSVEGAATRWSLPVSKTFDCQTNLSGAINSIKNAINASSSGNRFYYACGGPMEVPWRGINASDSSKRQHCTAISHSSWNDNHADTSQLTHTWTHIQSSGVKTVKIKDQNGGMNSAVSDWNWLRDSSVSAWQWLYTRRKTSAFDASDAGMVYYIITGRGDQDGNAVKMRDLFTNGPGGPGGGTTTPPPTGSTSVTSFTLINADTNAAIGALTNGQTLNLATLPTKNLSVRANTSPSTVGSVRFAYDGNANYQTESVAPYAIKGDTNGNYNAWTPSIGAHSLKATPYSGSGASGTAGTALSISFTVVNQTGNTPPTVSLSTNGTSFTSPASITMTATASDPGGSIAMVEFFNGNTFLGMDTTSPYTFTWSNVGAGTYNLKARATDNGALSTDSAIKTVTVSSGSTGPAVASFTLINADTDLPISGFNPIANGATINLGTLPTRRLNIRANTSPSTVGSVRFGLDANANYRTENVAPYAMAGDTSGDYYAWTPGAGAHSVTARAYSGSNAGGTGGAALTIGFNVTDSAARVLSADDTSDLAPGGTEMIDPDTAGDAGGSSNCGALGAEALLALGLLALLRRRR